MTEVLYSPVAGKTIELDNVNDEVFSQRLLGDGIAIKPEKREVCSPVDGVITMIYDTKHAIGIEMESGLEILIHIGIDTVMLKGVPFEMYIKVGDRVNKGDLLTIVDWSYIVDQGYDPIIMILAINKKVTNADTDKTVEQGDILFEIND